MKLGMIKINMKKFNIFTLISFLFLFAGIIFYLSWGIRFGVWYDIGVYSFSIIFILSGIFGILLTLYESSEENI